MSKKMKRLAIYAFFDKDGIADEYNFYLLNELNKYIDELIVVVIGKITNESREKFQNMAKHIISKENKGFDIWAHKTAIEFYGYNYIEQFDELIMLNSTFFGPLYPFSEMFDKMEQTDFDFWGITMHHYNDIDPMKKIKYGFVPEHIQSFFIAIRQKMLKSYEFKKYWDNLLPMNSYFEAVGFHEAIFTKHFADMGYSWGVYVDTNNIPTYAANPIFEDPYKLIKDFRCPILKRKNFLTDYNHLVGISTANFNWEAYNYVKNYTKYDTNLIWDNLLRLENQYDIYFNMGLNYIVSNNKLDKDVLKNKKLLFIMYISDDTYINETIEKIKSLPNFFDILIILNEEIKNENILKEINLIKNLTLRFKPNNKLEVDALYTTSKDIIFNYDLVCYINDKKRYNTTIDIITRSITYRAFYNLICDEDYILNIINLFDNEKRIGFITSPPSPSSIYYSDLCDQYWLHNFEATDIFLKNELNINANINMYKKPINSFDHSFWFRPEALHDLFELDLNYDDYKREVIKRYQKIADVIMWSEPYIVQKNGYLPIYISSNEMAKRELTTYQFITKNLNTQMFEKFGIYSYNSTLYNLSLLKPLRKDQIKTLKSRIRLLILKCIPRPVKELLKKILRR